VCLIDETGKTLWPSKVINDETAIIEAISAVRGRADHLTWAVDVTGTMSGLLLALLAAHDQSVKDVPGRIVNRMSETYRGEAKTDARDAYVIARSVRQRGDLTEVEVSATLIAELRLLVTHRADLVADRVRTINRLRDVLSGYFPALERAFDYAHSRSALVLLTGYQTPATIHRIGQSRLHALAGQAEGPQCRTDRCRSRRRGHHPAHCGSGPGRVYDDRGRSGHAVAGTR